MFKTKHKLQQFLKLANQMREYVFNLAKAINGLTKKVSSKVLWECTNEDTNSVTQTKNLKYFSLLEYSSTMIIESNTSDLYQGEVLKAKGIDNIKQIV